MVLEKLKILPNQPGCYLMKNKDGVIIYIGKAKNLKKRVNSYFKLKQTGKTAMLVKEIVDFDYVITKTEIESLVLELNLIKKHQPKYNILYRDDKTYPYIGITNEKVPRLKVYRSLYKEKENMILYGPYPSAMAAKSMVELLNRLYPLPKCKTFPKQKCLYYHIGECLGYCTEEYDPLTVNKMVKEIKSILAGNYKQIQNKIKNEMLLLNEKMMFERSLELAKYLEAMKVIFDQQKVELKQMLNADFIGYYVEGEYLALNILFMRHGKLINSKTYIYPIINDVIDELSSFIVNHYQTHQIKPEFLIIRDDIIELSNVIGLNVKNPQKGDLLKVLALSENNAFDYFKNNIENIINKEQQNANNWHQLAMALNLNDINKIEMFDNAHLFGTYAVSGMIVYKNGEKQTHEYRKYKIKYSKTNDDYAMLKEVMYRRYNQLLVDGLELPDIILVDGGIGQVNAALEVVNDLNLNTKIFGLVKDKKHNSSNLIDINGNEIKAPQNVWHLLTNIQKEVHRYTITYHEKTRNKQSIASELDQIKGLGPKRRALLYNKYNHIQDMKKASREELVELLGNKIGEYLYNLWQQ